MPQLENLKINWQQAVQIGAVLFGLASFGFMLQYGIKAMEVDVQRIETELRAERAKRESNDREFSARLERMQTDATAERLRQIELLTELRTDVRQLRAVMERLSGGGPPR